jgi:glycosyltransferase involved in cell wall biosynthesis
MPEPLPLLSVIIPVFNGEATIGACLLALYASKFRDFEVIVVDDKSTDETALVVRAFHCRLIRCAENNGPAAARNLAASHSSGKYLFFLDADILVEPNSLGEIVDAFTKRPEIGALFGSFHRDSVPANFFSRYKNLVHHHTHQISRENASTFCGGFGAIRSKVFLSAGGFDPQHRFLEDVELGMRLHQAGNPIWLHKKLRFSHCKRYTLWGLIRSDLFQRAVPWTRLILRTGEVHNDLNTQTSNILSVPVAYLLLVGLPAFAFTYGAFAWLCLLLVFLGLNREFLALGWREFGVWFALRSAATCWMIYLLSGLGVVLGAFGHLSEELRAEAEEVEPAP